MSLKYSNSYSDSYGAPQAPPIGNYDPNGGYGNNYQVPSTIVNEIAFTLKLGQVALIAFIVLVVFVVAFLLLMCCMYCPSLFGGGYQQHQQHPDHGYYNQNMGNFHKKIFRIHVN